MPQALSLDMRHRVWVSNVVIEEPESLKVEYRRYLMRLEKAVQPQTEFQRHNMR